MEVSLSKLGAELRDEGETEKDVSAYVIQDEQIPKSYLIVY